MLYKLKTIASGLDSGHPSSMAPASLLHLLLISSICRLPPHVLHTSGSLLLSNHSVNSVSYRGMHSDQRIYLSCFPESSILTLLISSPFHLLATPFEFEAGKGPHTIAVPNNSKSSYQLNPYKRILCRP